MNEKNDIDKKIKNVCKTISESLLEAQENINSINSDSWFESGLTKHATETIIKQSKKALLSSGLMVTRQGYDVIKKNNSSSSSSTSYEEWLTIKFNLEKVATGNAAEFNVEVPFRDKSLLAVYLDRGLAILLRGLLLPTIEQVER